MRYGLPRDRQYVNMVALWLCTLIVSLPLATASTLRVEQISGEDGVNGIRRMTDTITATATVIGTEDVAALPQQLIIRQGSLGGRAFDSCAVASSNAYTCQFSGSQDQKPKGRVPYTITLHPDTPNAVSVSASVEVDGEGPGVQRVSSDATAVTGGSIQLSYAVQDKACPTCSKCAGIGKVEVYVAESNVLLQTFTVDGGECTLSETRQVAVGGLPNGVSHLCIVPQDAFGNVQDNLMDTAGVSIGANCVALTKDDRAPEVLSLALTYRGTEVPVDYLGETAGQLSLNVRVKTNTFPLAENAVRADLSQIGLGNTRIPCHERFTNEYECEQDITGLITQGGQKTLTVEARDSQGNTATESFTANIGLDTDVPIVTSFRTTYSIQRDGQTVSVLGRTNNTFTVDLQESGSGFDANNVYVTISGAQLRMNCTGNTCSGRYQVSGTPSTLAATVSGSDDVGHRFSTGKVFTVDVTPPVLADLTVANSNLLPYIVQGDDLIVTAKLRDDTGVSGELSTADFSNVSANANIHPSCQTNSTGSVCQWILLDVSPALQLVGSFRFSDAANNILATRVERFKLLFEQNGEVLTKPEGVLSIARNANITTANFWQPRMQGPMPGFLDEDTAQVVPYRAWWEVSFTGGGSAEIVDTEFNPAACRGEDIETVQDIELVYPDPLKREKFLTKVTFQRGAITKGELTFQCPVGTTSVLGNAIYPREMDNLTFTIPVIRAGEISDAVKDEIKRTKNSWLVKAEFIGTISKYLTLGKNICNTLYTLGNLLRALQSLGIKMEWMYHNPLTGGFARAFVGGAQGATEAGKGLFKLVDRMCKWVSCQQVGNLGEKHGPSAWYAKFVKNHKINNLGQVRQGPRAAEFPTATIWPADPSQSLILSLVSLCIPGIFFNLQKARQIECQYLSCLNEQVAHGTPVFVCSKLRNYGWCRYVIGEVFQLIPFAHFFQSFAGTVQQMLANPISLFLSIADSKWVCGAWVPISGAKWGFCNLVHQIVVVGDVLADIKALKDTDWKLSSDSCEDVLDKVEEGENQEPEETP